MSTTTIYINGQTSNTQNSTEPSKKIRDGIVLNRMFVGDYCLENIGHEIINLFRADNGKYYIYLNSRGDFGPNKKGRVEYVLLTRNCPTANTIQIIGKAKVKEEIYDPSNPDDQKNNPLVKDICYGKASIIDLFNANTKDQNIYVTYEVEDIVEPARELYISFDNEAKQSGNSTGSRGSTPEPKIVNMAKSSLKQYIFKEDYSSAHEVLLNAIENDSYWKTEPVGVVNPEEPIGSRENFFKICRIQNNELVYSNAFAYLANKYRPEFCRFAKEVMNLSLEEDFEIHREKWNIDILLNDQNNVVVIENKVLSHISGVWFNRDENNETSQLEKYWNIVTGNENQFNPVDKNGHREYEGLTASFYIVAPDHNDIDLKRYLKGEEYKKIVYSQIRDFIASYKSNDPFIEQLLLAMEPHCQKSFDYYSDMKTAFFEQCAKFSNK